MLDSDPWFSLLVFMTWELHEYCHQSYLLWTLWIVLIEQFTFDIWPYKNVILYDHTRTWSSIPSHSCKPLVETPPVQPTYIHGMDSVWRDHGGQEKWSWWEDLVARFRGQSLLRHLSEVMWFCHVETRDWSLPTKGAVTNYPWLPYDIPLLCCSTVSDVVRDYCSKKQLGGKKHTGHGSEFSEKRRWE